MDLKELKYKVFKENRVRHPWESARFNVTCRIIEEQIKDKDLKIIFDIGCGDTFFIESLSSKFTDCKFFAIDIAFSDEFIQEKSIALNKKNIYLFKDVDTALFECNQEVSLILLMDVIEHIESDSKFLLSLSQKKHISNNTFFFITVPAFQNLFCEHDIFLEHFRRYSNNSLKHLLMNCGFKIDKIGYFFTILLIPRIINIIIEKIQKDKKIEVQGLSTWNGGRFKSKIIEYILIFDFFIFKIFNNKFPGLSNFVICRKSV
jgi:hypothetical protein